MLLTMANARKMEGLKECDKFAHTGMNGKGNVKVESEQTWRVDMDSIQARHNKTGSRAVDIFVFMNNNDFNEQRSDRQRIRKNYSLSRYIILSSRLRHASASSSVQFSSVRSVQFSTN